MPDLRRVHRFRDHPIEGVNWRPTRFVDEVPGSGVCGLCRMIPKQTVVLPCLHTLCQACHAASSQGAGGRCPLDQEPFEEAECGSYHWPSRKANALKVHCWNEAHGCEFEGAMEFMLRHYEKECTFHTVDCLRCGEEVLHKELSRHYAAGCISAVSSTRAENASSDSQILTIQDVMAALEELKAPLRDANHEQLLLAIQSQMNEPTEQNRNHEHKSAVNTETVAAPAMSGITQVAEPSTSTSSQQGTSRQKPTEETSTSSTSRSCPKEMLMPRQLEPLVDLPEDVLQRMSKTSSQDYPQHVITQILPLVTCDLELTGPLPKTFAWRKVLGSVTYILSVDNPLFTMQMQEFKAADITVLHTRDAYFTVEVYGNGDWPSLVIKFHGMLGGSNCPAPALIVKMFSPRVPGLVRLSSSNESCNCKHDRDSWTHCYRRYSVDPEDPISSRILEYTTINYRIELCRP